MPRFEVILKRQCQEVRSIVLEAKDEDDAQRFAIAIGDNDGDLVWAVNEWEGCEAHEIEQLDGDRKSVV